MPRLSSRLAVLVLILGFSAGHEAVGADPKKAAITDIRLVDSDFAYQGEYVGFVGDPCQGCVPVGLQVVAHGDGKFEAVEYRGGLPGYGWDRLEKRRASGALKDGVVVLSGESREIVIDATSAALRDSGGQLIGQLRKIERLSPSLHATAPCGAIVLFDGSSTDQLENAKVTAEGLLEVGATTKFPVGDCRLHVEFKIPYMPHPSGQGRGNSGVYVQQRYEIQILDSFGAEGAEGDCGGVYRQQRPDVNMCLPPLSWQTYDIWFTAARFDADGQKVANARITVLHNGVPVHWNREIKTKTGAGKPEGPENLPILFQNHGNPVHFRNLWIVLEPQPTEVCQNGKRFPRACRLLQRLRRCR